MACATIGVTETEIAPPSPETGAPLQAQAQSQTPRTSLMKRSSCKPPAAVERTGATAFCQRRLDDL